MLFDIDAEAEGNVSFLLSVLKLCLCEYVIITIVSILNVKYHVLSTCHHLLREANKSKYVSLCRKYLNSY